MTYEEAADASSADVGDKHNTLCHRNDNIVNGDVSMEPDMVGLSQVVR